MSFLLIIITILFLCVITYLSINHKEPFITYIKDKQLIGTIDRTGIEDNNYPLSSVRNDNAFRRNEEVCYGTLNVESDKISKNDRGLCVKNGSANKEDIDRKKYRITEGERAPSMGMYAIDFSNYEIYYEREIKGKPLKGKINAGNMILTLDNSGRPVDKVMISNDGITQTETSKRLTISKTKSICDELGSNCAGFTVFTPTENNPDNIDTVFYSIIDNNSNDPYSLDYEFSNVGQLSQNSEAKYLKNNPGAVSYVKKNPNYVEKPLVKLDLGAPLNHQWDINLNKLVKKTVRERLNETCPISSSERRADGILYIEPDGRNPATREDYLFSGCKAERSCDNTDFDPISQNIIDNIPNKAGCGAWNLGNYDWNPTLKKWVKKTVRPL